MENKLREDAKEILDTGLFSSKINDILYDAISESHTVDRLSKENEYLKEAVVVLLKALIGQPIYWAHPDWRMETHIIRDVEYRVVDSDFFDRKDRKYEGKKCICIEVDEDGYYLADFIGKTLFFDKEEALSHARKEL